MMEKRRSTLSWSRQKNKMQATGKLVAFHMGKGDCLNGERCDQLSAHTETEDVSRQQC
jgi:hypothetical protein